MGNAWDPERYLKFRAQRREPYEDLLALVQARTGMRIADLGCGPGELTVDLAERFDAASVVGVDHSPAMLRRAATVTDPRVSFVQADIADHPLRGLDLIVSNAALHWLPEHPALFETLRDGLAEDGQLAVQMPNNFAQPTHTTAAALAGESPFARVLGSTRSGAAVESAERYATLLHSLGFREQIVREHLYLHELPDAAAAVEWVKGSMLTWYEPRLGPELYAEFVRLYEQRLLANLGPAAPFPFTYRRIILWARR
ncbi:MAG: methyltransferase domain-containing protein [Nannocystaceae bacterium]|nr:methyltransferase domain-containing protein [Nannocystaceae bacterium]